MSNIDSILLPVSENALTSEVTFQNAEQQMWERVETFDFDITATILRERTRIKVTVNFVLPSTGTTVDRLVTVEKELKSALQEKTQPATIRQGGIGISEPADYRALMRAMQIALDYAGQLDFAHRNG